jgi:hypothetical protein
MIEAGVLPRAAKAWSRHGSTRYLWTDKSIEDACQYVIEGQGIDLPANAAFRSGIGSTADTEPRP